MCKLNDHLMPIPSVKCMAATAVHIGRSRMTVASHKAVKLSHP